MYRRESSSVFLLLLLSVSAVLLLGHHHQWTHCAESPPKYNIIQTIQPDGLQNLTGIYMWNNEIYFANTGQHVIQKIKTNTGQIETIAGQWGKPGFDGDGGEAVQSTLDTPTGIFILNDGAIYIADRMNGRIRKISNEGTIDTIAGSGQRVFSNFTSNPMKAEFDPFSVFVVSDDLYYIADTVNNVILRVVNGNNMSIAAGHHVSSGPKYDDGSVKSATSANLNQPHGVFVQNNKLYISEMNNYLRMVDENDSTSLIVVEVDISGLRLSNYIQNPTAVHVTKDDVIFIADTGNNRISRTRSGEVPVTVVGGLSNPTGLYVNETDGRIIVSDSGNDRIVILHPTCDNGFVLNSNGSKCFSFWCFGRESNDTTNVCSGNGKCVGDNICDCNPGFTGSNCDVKLGGQRLQIEGIPTGFVTGKNQAIDIKIRVATFRSGIDFVKTKKLVNNDCVNCTWTNIQVACKMVVGGDTIITIDQQNTIAYYTGQVSADGLFNLTFNPVISIKGNFPSNPTGDISLHIIFSDSTESGPSIFLFDYPIPSLAAPVRTSTQSTIIPATGGMALSTIYTINDTSNNWNIPSNYSVSFAIGFLNHHQPNAKIARQPISRITEFSSNLTFSFYLPYIMNSTFKSTSETINLVTIVRDSFMNEYTFDIGQVEVIPNNENSSTLITRIRSDERLSKILPYDSLNSQNIELVLEMSKTMNFDLKNPSVTLSTINQISSQSSIIMNPTISLILQSKLENFLKEMNNINSLEKTKNGYLSTQRMSEDDFRNTLSTASNLLSSGFTNVSSLCSQLSSLMVQQEGTKVVTNSIHASLYTSNSINITISNFMIHSSRNGNNAHQNFSDISLNTDYILSKYGSFNTEVGLSLVTYNEKLFNNGNSTQLTKSKDFTLYKLGSPISLSELSQPILITFSIESNSNWSSLSISNYSSQVSCQFWNETTHQWDRNGCSLHSFNNQSKQLTCQCTHTTLFAAFVEQESLYNSEYLNQVSSLYIAQISFGSLFLILSIVIVSLLFVFRKEQPISSRFITPFIGMIALCVECIFLLITQRSILLGYAQSVLSTINNNDYEYSQSPILRLQNGDLTSNIISNIFTIIVNSMVLTAIFAYLYQVVRYQVLKYFYHQILTKFNNDETETNQTPPALLKITKLFLSTRIMLVIMSLFITLNAVYWTLWVILVRCEVITGNTYTYIVSISFTCSILLLGFSICFMIVLDWCMTLFSKRREQSIIERGGNDQQEQVVQNSTSNLSSPSVNNLISGKGLKLNRNEMKKTKDTVLRVLYDYFIRIDSPLYFRGEMLIFVMCFTFLIISQIIGLSGLAFKKQDSFRMLLVNDSISLLFDILYLFSYLLVFGGFAILVRIIHLVQKKKNKNKLSEKESEMNDEELTQLLEHAEGLKLFEWFSEKEFSLENLQLYLELKKSEVLIEKFSMSNFEQVKTVVNHIHSTYIDRNSLKEVNIPSDCKKSFESIVKKFNEFNILELQSKKDQKPEFHENFKASIMLLKDQVLINLSDTYSRFVNTKQYEIYQEIVNYKSQLMKQANLE